MLNLFEILQLYNEMAYERKKVVNKFQDKNEKRIYHLMYIFFFRNNESCEHWIDEVTAFTENSYRVKPKNKLLSSNDIYKLIWLEPKDLVNVENINRFLNIAYKSKGLPKIEKYSFNNLYNFLDDFFKWVSLELSRYDLVDAIDTKIKELLNNYSVED